MHVNDFIVRQIRLVGSALNGYLRRSLNFVNEYDSFIWLLWLALGLVGMESRAGLSHLYGQPSTKRELITACLQA